jgi:hypothetical protein
MSRVADAPSKRIASSAAVPAGNWSSVSIDDVHAPIKNAQTLAPSREVAAQTAAAVAERPQASQLQQPAIPPQSAGFDTHPAVVLAKGAGNDPFAISSESQRDVVRALAWKSAACIWGGPLLTMICFYILSEILGWL